MGRPVAARPRNVENSTACMDRWARVKRTKKRSLAWDFSSTACAASVFARSVILSSLGRLAPDLVNARADQPQDGMNHKERKHAGKQQVHEQANEVKRRRS